jgi:hypothetical protein
MCRGTLAREWRRIRGATTARCLVAVAILVPVSAWLFRFVWCSR